jgi:alkylation response protein AidB-like acyl-CoA dehydrogenase
MGKPNVVRYRRGMTSADLATPLSGSEAVRSAVRAFLDESFDRDIPLRTWLERLADSGWGTPQWPTQWFGKGLSNDLAAAAFDEFRKAKAPGPPAGLGRMLAAPTIIAHGSDEQKQRYVRSILIGDDAWCQLFSEPGAGSDLASLQTRAELDGSEYVVNGQKVWTSGARGADLGMLLARTDVDVPKHRGISYFAFDMDQPGVEVRPLKQITGDAMFAEVFFTDARVPAGNVIGELNGGWGVAMTTLMNERVGLGAGSALGFPLSAPTGKRVQQQLEQSVGEFIASERGGAVAAASAGAMVGRGIDQLVDLAKQTGRGEDTHVRQQLARLYTLTKLNSWNGLRAKESAKSGAGLSPAASLGKLMVSHVTRQWRETAMTIAAGDSMLAGSDGPMDGGVARQALFAPAPSIYGGSDQVQRNIIGERVLGLPKDPDVSRDVPFRDLRVGTQNKSAS